MEEFKDALFDEVHAAFMAGDYDEVRRLEREYGPHVRGLRVFIFALNEGVADVMTDEELIERIEHGPPFNIGKTITAKYFFAKP